MVRFSSEPHLIICVQTWNIGAQFPSQIAQALDVSWPQEVGAVASGRTDVLCTGPADWLMISATVHAAEPLHELSANQRSPFRATDVSSAYIRFQIEGPTAWDLLSKACALDTHPARFPPERCRCTRFAGMPVTVWRTDVSRFECLAPSSYQEYMAAWLEDAIVEFNESRLEVLVQRGISQRP